MLNRVILMGRITRDLEIRQTPNGNSVLRFTVAVDRPVKQGAEKQTDFISCTAWGQQAEFIGRYFGKGRMIALEGSIRTGSYDKNGVTVYTTDVNVERVSFTGEPRQDGGNGGYGNSYQGNGGYNNNNYGGNNYQQPQQNNYQPQYNQPPQQNNMSIGGMEDFEEIISDDGVPF
ncbi:MAG: single-stranded DNA-binding protein [Ruminococcus sp.]|nr:single-stranded DNA-binding protein [Ruminococcus sp.]